MKRFTSTDKWDDPWFWELSPQAKLLWLFLCDHCDHAGIFDVSLKLASMKIGEAIEEQHLAELQSRIHTLKSGKRLITSFIRFQYGKLNPDCKPHRPAFVSLEKHGITLAQLDTICNGYPNSIKGHQEGSDTLKDPNKEKDKEKDKTGSGWGTLGIIRERLNRMFGRKATDPWDYAEEHALATVAKRPDAVFELGEIQKFKDSLPPEEAKFSGLPKTLGKLLDGWGGALDLARAGDAAKKNGGANRDDDRVLLDAKPPKRSTERLPYPGFPAGFAVDRPPLREYFRDDRAFETCQIAYEDWLEWRKRELAKQEKTKPATK